MAALRLSFKDARSTEARISGGFDHSRYVGSTRGGPNNADDLNLSRAENKVKAAAEQPNATVEDRQTLARVYLARDTSEYARKALAIINQLIAGGVETAEVLNDKAVALFQLGEYDEAMAFFSEALAKSPAYNEALFNRALVEGHTGRNEDARRDWKQFISESHDEKWKAEAQSRLNSLDGSSNR
jgi:tetratricopeptide (TPR) repeat protein